MHPGCTIDQVYLYREPIDFRKAPPCSNMALVLTVRLEMGGQSITGRLVKISSATTLFCLN
jgi:hypothetical protein